MKSKTREYWLEGYNGPCKGGYFFRSDIFKDLDEFEKRTGKHVVAIKLERDYDSNKPSLTIELVQ